jgi:hypothetical protein
MLKEILKKVGAGLLVSMIIFANFSLVVLAAPDQPSAPAGGVDSSQSKQAAKDKAETISRGTVLPKNTEAFDTLEMCKELMDFVNYAPEYARGVFTDGNEISIFGNDAGEADVLACGIRTGTIKLWMVPYYVRYILEFIIQLAGLVSVGGIIYGAYIYLFSGFGMEKDQGKKAIIYSLGGMAITLLAWAAVNIVISVLTL